MISSATLPLKAAKDFGGGGGGMSMDDIFESLWRYFWLFLSEVVVALDEEVEEDRVRKGSNLKSQT